MAGLDPYEERLLIILLGSGVGVIFALVLLVICCRKYRLDKNTGGGQERKWTQQQLMFQQPGRPAYFPTGHQMSVNMNMDPAYLDPTRAGYIQPTAGPSNLNPTYASAAPRITPNPQQQQLQAARQTFQQAENTTYAGMAYGRQGTPAGGVSYSSHQV